MKIADFNNLIKELPFLNQSFEIKKKNWKVKEQQDLIDRIFSNKDIINISRQDLFGCRFNDVEEFILKTLMWGYPTRGRGKNIDYLLAPENFKKLINLIEIYRFDFEKKITTEQLKKDFKNISSIGISTITKLLYFLYKEVNGHQSVILDLRVIEVINSDRFVDFNSIRNISYQNAFTYYPEYLKIINQLSEELGVYPDQIEMFLFVFGNNVSTVESRILDRMNSDIDGGKFISISEDQKSKEKSDKKKIYRNNLIESCETLSKIQQEMFGKIINVAMSGEYKELDDVFDEGNSFEFDLNYFKNTNDINLTNLVCLFEQIDKAKQSIININAINKEEFKDN